MSSREGLLAALRRPVDAASLGFLRAAFGLVVAFEIARFFAGGWIAEHYLDPTFHFTYAGFGWVRPLPPVAFHAFFGLLFASAVGLALGFLHRVSALFFALGFAYVFLLEKARYLNHFYLVILLALLLAALPVDRAFALDARRRALPATVPAWVLGLVRFQIGIVYFYAGVAKLNEDWLLRAEPLLRWLASPTRADRPILGSLYAFPETAWAFSWGGFLLDLCAWPMLAWKRTRVPMFALLVVFHLLNAATFGIGIFPWLMIPATAVFFEPDWPRRFAPLRALAGNAAKAASTTAVAARERLGLAFAAVWVAVQVLVPLRHFAYPGSVHWTEEGHAFAWHMMLRSKDGQATFVVRDPASGETWIVDPRNELTPRQAQKLAGRPDMVLQYAHHLRDQWRARGFAEVEVRARVVASLNGRPRQLLVDPEVDLAAVEPSILAADWIVPLD